MPKTEIHICQCSRCQQDDVHAEKALHRQMNLLSSRLDEQQRRWYVAVESNRMGVGGDRLLSQITGLDEKTIGRWAARAGRLPYRTTRRAGAPAGRWSAEGGKKDAELESVLERVIEPETAGDPMKEQKWIRSSLRHVSQRLKDLGHGISPPTVSRLLRKLGYSLHVNEKKLEASANHPERNTQFASIQAQKERFQVSGDPIISVDTKKKELIGNFKNAGRAWTEEPEAVNAHDFRP